MSDNTIILYGIPAYGHIHSNLYLAGSLAAEGFRVIYYATEPFRAVIEANGCEYRPYSFLSGPPDLSDGKRILKLYRLLLQYTAEMLPGLVEDARRDSPCAVMFDSLALWGRAVGRMLHVPVFSFYSIAAISRPGGAGLWRYAAGFAGGFFRYVGELPRAFSLRRDLHKTGVRDLGLFSVLMGTGDYNLMGYARRFQPGGLRFGKAYHFLGPLAVYRTVVEENDFVCPAGPLVYVSLGTVFNENRALFREIVRQFGAGGPGDGFPYRVVIAGMMGMGGTEPLPENIIMRPFVRQAEIMKRAALFVTAGGMNSIHEALYYRVPCLLVPGQGEQCINAMRFEKLGFGRILRDVSALRREAEQAMRLRQSWREAVREELLAVHVDEALALFRRSRHDTG